MTLIAPIRLEESVEASLMQVAERVITFEDFLDIENKAGLYELQGGVLIKKMAAQIDHEWLVVWLITVLNTYAKAKKLGAVFGSRTAIQIDQTSGRIPDILFVRQERFDILHERALIGAPDLVVEIVSPNDRPGYLRQLESDYLKIGVPEILFVDRRKGEARLHTLEDNRYRIETFTEGAITLTSLGGLELKAEWLLHDPRPDEYEILLQLTEVR